MSNILTHEDGIVLVESRRARDRYVEHDDVLDKVRSLFLMPQINMATMAQVAEYYEVSIDTIKNSYKRHIDEYQSDGVRVWSAADVDLAVKGLIMTPFEKHGPYTEFALSDDVTLRVPIRGVTLFTKRGVLRAGMLLRDSAVAKAVRTALLDIETAVENLDVALGQQESAGSQDDLAKVYGQALEVIVRNDARYTDLEEKFNKLQSDYEILRESNRCLEEERDDYEAAFDAQTGYINELREKLAGITAKYNHYHNTSCVAHSICQIGKLGRVDMKTLWTDFYVAMSSQYQIHLPRRGYAPYYKHIHSDEWPQARAVIAELCDKYGVDKTQILWEEEPANI